MKSLLLATAFALPASLASAATMTFEATRGGDTIQLVADDMDMSGTTTFSLSTVSGMADLLGFGFNSDLTLDADDIDLVSSTNADDDDSSVALKLFTDADEKGKGDANDTTSFCGEGCNFNGNESASEFDYILRLGEQGSSGDDFVKTATFTIAGNLSDFSAFAIRAQSTGPNGEDSIKADFTEVPAIPLPAGGLLLLSGLAGVVALRRRKRAA